MKRVAAVFTTLLALGGLPGAQERSGPRFYSDDPIARVPETQDASKVQARELSLTYDAIINLFGRPGTQQVGRAASVNTIDEVPDSSWFTNRVGTRPLTEDEMLRGPSDDRGPAPGQWTVNRKATGASPGLVIDDSRGRRYFIKFDPPGYPELGTATEVIVTRVFHALGYHVPHASIGTLRPQDLVIAADAQVRTPGGGRRRMRLSDIDEQLDRAHRNADGTYRIVAGAGLGAPLEGFLYEGTRKDDPNDIVPHEDRRELRGLRVFSAWVNHTDAKAINSLDTLVSESGRSVVRHHLIDFNAALGSAGIGPKERRDGYEYIAEFGPALKALPGFGFVIRPWMTVDYPEYRGIGRFEASSFVPEAWRPRVPNPAYVRSRPDDTFWAARKLMAMTDDLIRAAVRAGQLTDSAAEKYLVGALIERRDKIGRAWLTPINPIVDPTLAADGTLTFANAAVAHGFAPAPRGYAAVWHTYDNGARTATRIGETEGTGPQLRAPSIPSGAAFVRVDIRATDPDANLSAWTEPVYAYFRRSGTGWQLVGFERMPSAPLMRPGLVGAERIPTRESSEP
jgi:hypothetical protein